MVNGCVLSASLRSQAVQMVAMLSSVHTILNV
jgi:hypothetical protein